MRATLFFGGVLILFLGAGIFAGAIGTRTAQENVNGVDQPVYGVCAQYSGDLHCIPISENTLHFLNSYLAMPQISVGATLRPETGNYLY